MSEIFKKLQARLGRWWSAFKKTVAVLSVWGLAFSLVTVGRLKVAFDYDDTLVFSTPAFQRAFDSGAQPYTPGFWQVVNNSYDLESRKLLANAMAWALKIFGFHVTVIVNRPATDGEGLRKEWRWLASSLVFIPDAEAKSEVLSHGRYVLYLGDSDTDIREGRAAKVATLRVRRSRRSRNHDDYHPGSLGEWVIPLSEH